MPIYEYQCISCGNNFEELVFSETDMKLKCPKCSSTDTKKLMSASGIISGSLKEPGCAATCHSPESCHSGGGCCMQ